MKMPDARDENELLPKNATRQEEPMPVGGDDLLLYSAEEAEDARASLRELMEAERDGRTRTTSPPAAPEQSPTAAERAASDIRVYLGLAAESKEKAEWCREKAQDTVNAFYTPTLAGRDVFQFLVALTADADREGLRACQEIARKIVTRYTGDHSDMRTFDRKEKSDVMPTSIDAKWCVIWQGSTAIGNEKPDYLDFGEI